MRNVLITGASTGIGYATTKYLLDRNYRVFGSVRTEEDAKRLEADFSKNFEALLFDVTDAHSITNAAVYMNEKLEGDGLTGLINNAGIAVSGPLQLIDMEDFKKQFDVNVFGVMRVTQAFLPLLGAKEYHPKPVGKIINISSIAGRFTMPFVGPYAASKYALESITNSFRRELLLYGIDSVAIQPGPIQSAIWEKAREDIKTYPGTIYESILRNSKRMINGSEKTSIPPELVAQRIEKILRSKSRTRYVISGKKIRHYLTFYSPPRLADYVIKKAFQRAQNNRNKKDEE